MGEVNVAIGATRSAAFFSRVQTETRTLSQQVMLSRGGARAGHLSLSLIYFSMASLPLAVEITCSPENSFAPIPKTRWRQSEDEASSRLYSCRSVVGYISTPHSDQQSITSRLPSLLESSDVLTEESKTNLKLISMPTLPRQTHRFFNPSSLPPSTRGKKRMWFYPLQITHI